MDPDLLYDIARYDPDGEELRLIERAGLLRRDGVVWKVTEAGEQPVAVARDVVEALYGDSTLIDVPENQVACITATDEALARLPMLLRAFGGGPDPDRWSEALWQQHVSSYSPLEMADKEDLHRSRPVYVNGTRWGPWEIADGLTRCLPIEDDESAWFPRYWQPWAQLSFSELGSRTSGWDVASLGLVTAGTIASTYVGDEGDPYVTSLRVRPGDDAQAFAEWLLEGEMSTRFFDGHPLGERLLVQLFIEAHLRGFSGKECWGDALLGIEGNGGIVGSAGTSEWTLTLDLPDAVAESVLDVLAARRPALAAVIAAAR